MNLKEIMEQHSFAVLGDTRNPEKYACKIRNAMLEAGYQVWAVPQEVQSLNDIEGDIDIIDLCIHPAKGLKLLQECRKPFQSILIQPGAGSPELIRYLEENQIPYLEGCLLVGLSTYRNR